MGASVARVGILGYGSGGQRFHAPLIAATPGLDLTLIVTANPERAEHARATYPGADIVPDADTLFDRVEDLDLVVVTTPNRTHAPLALRAIESGTPVVVDKPFAPTVLDAQRVVDAAEAAGVGLTVFQNGRWDSGFLTVRELIASGRLGSVFRFESRYDRWRPKPKDNWREFGDPAEAGGLLYDLGAHIVDQALRLFGPVAQVYAELDRRRPGVHVDDDTFVALHHVNGVRSHLWTSVLAATRNPRFRVLGDQGTFTKYGLDVQERQAMSGMKPGEPGWGVEPEADRGTFGDGERTELVPTEIGDYPRFYAQVRDALRGEAPFPVDPRSAVDALRVIEAARRSADQGTVVTI
ncbi:MAG TPA: Gfo/Idh/MocA family oxidoreductase [Pseudonocardiaceae bacterium]|jgi:predicted dehydrogenase